MNTVGGSWRNFRGGIILSITTRSPRAGETAVLKLHGSEESCVQTGLLPERCLSAADNEWRHKRNLSYKCLPFSVLFLTQHYILSSLPVNFYWPSVCVSVAALTEQFQQVARLSIAILGEMHSSKGISLVFLVFIILFAFPLGCYRQ